jgi:hypothetical protein
MKVGFQDKKRKLPEWPVSLDELRKVVSRKFTERNLIEEPEQSVCFSQLQESQESMVSYMSKQSKNKVNKRK